MAGDDDAARGRRIRERREQLGLTLEDVSARPIDPVGRTVGAGPSTIAEWEAGANPGKAKLERLAAALRTSWRYLATGDEDTGTRIAQLRFERGMTQADLAKAVGAATQGPSNSRTVQVWESASDIRIREDTLERIADALGTTPRFLLTGEASQRMERRRGGDMRPSTKGEVSELRGDLTETQRSVSDLIRGERELRKEVVALRRLVEALRRRLDPPSSGNPETDG